MDLRHLATFCEVVAQGSLLGAARVLGCAQSTVTLHLQGLEAALGVTLLERGGRRVRLTEAGRTLHDQAGSLLGRVATLRETMAEIATGESGHVRLGCIEPCASRRLPPILVRFCRERPGVRLSVEVAGTVSTARAVVAGELDAGICSRPPAIAGLAGLTFQPFYTEEMALLLRTDHPLADAPVIHAADLVSNRLMFTEEGCAWRDLTRASLDVRGISPPVTIEISSMQALTMAVQSGLGIAIVPVAVADPPPAETVLRPIADVDLGLVVGLIRPADAPPPSRALTDFLSACRSHLPRERGTALRR